MMKVQVNKHRTGRVGNCLFGLAQILDGFVRVLSFGFLHTTATLDLSRWQAQRFFNRMRKETTT